MEDIAEKIFSNLANKQDMQLIQVRFVEQRTENITYA